MPLPKGSPYFAKSARVDLGPKLVSKVEDSRNNAALSKLTGVQHDAYLYYYGFDPSGFHATSSIHRAGEQGELADFRVNHGRALVNALKNLVTSQKIIWRPRAASYGADAVRETELASNILEYYWTERQVAHYVDIAVEQAIALTEGFVFYLWDDQLGEEVSPDPNRPDRFVKSGDIAFYNTPSWDVIRDPRKPAWSQLDWVIVRRWVNRFDLAERYGPDKKIPGSDRTFYDAILEAPEDAPARKEGGVKQETDDVALYHFFHRRGAALPRGREVTFLASGEVLEDSILTYDEIPLVRIVPAELFGTPFGYSPYLEVMGIQELIDSLSSAIATNQTTFAVQNIIADQGTEISPDSLPGGLNVLYKPVGSEGPKPLQLTSSPKEVFDFLETLKADQTRLFGLNDVVLGEAPSGEMSGAGMALLSQAALQQSSTLQANTLRAAQSLGTGILKTVQRKCWAPRKVDLVGKTNSFLVKPPTEYDGKSIGKISKVLVDIGNPLEQTTTGRFELAGQYQQLGVKLTYDQIQQLITTGRLDPLTRGLQSELLNIVSENEQITEGVVPDAMIHDDHLLHGREHRIPGANPEARSNPELLKAQIAHIHQHYSLYYGVPVDAVMNDPLYRERMLILMGMQPPPPMMPPGMPVGPDGAPMGPPPPGGEAPPPPPAEAPPGAPPSGAEAPGLPSFPTNPSTGQEWDPATAGGAVMPPAA